MTETWWIHIGCQHEFITEYRHDSRDVLVIKEKTNQGLGLASTDVKHWLSTSRGDRFLS